MLLSLKTPLNILSAEWGLPVHLSLKICQLKYDIQKGLQPLMREGGKNNTVLVSVWNYYNAFILCRQAADISIVNRSFKGYDAILTYISLKWWTSTYYCFLFPVQFKIQSLKKNQTTLKILICVSPKTKHFSNFNELKTPGNVKRNPSQSPTMSLRSKTHPKHT